MALTGYEVIETDLGTLTSGDGPQEGSITAPTGKRFLSVSHVSTGTMGATSPPYVHADGATVSWRFIPMGGDFGAPSNTIKVYAVAADVAPEEE